MCKHEKTLELKRFLEEEGYVPWIDDDGDVIFKVEGMTLFAAFDSEDDPFVRLVLPGFWPIEDEEERETATDVAHSVNRDIKAAKVYIVRDRVWATIETFSETVEAFTAVFHRSLGALRGAAHRFAAEMRSDVPTGLFSVADLVWPEDESHT